MDLLREKRRLSKKVKGLTYYLIRMKRKGYEELLRNSRTLADMKADGLWKR